MGLELFNTLILLLLWLRFDRLAGEGFTYRFGGVWSV